MQKNRIFLVLLVVLFFVLAGYFVSKNNPTSLNRYLVRCRDQAPGEVKTKCWKGIVEESLEKEGLDQSMEVIAALYDSEPDFQPICHDFVHIVGKKAYELFDQGKDFKVSEKTSYCAYGFYHGFMESMVSKKGDVTEAKRFCEYVNAQLSRSSPSANLACFHGIGHGWTNVHDEKLWGQERAMVDPAIKLCEQVTEDPEERKICVTGIFDSISIGYYNEAYGLKIRKNDPYWLCREQKEVYKTPCYMDLSPAVIWLGDYNLGTSLGYLDKVENKYKDLVARTLAENSIRFLLKNSEDPRDYVAVCRKLMGTRIPACFTGLASGFLQFGDPGRVEVRAINFCKEDYLSAQEKDWCFESVLKNLSMSVSADKYKEVCNSLGEESKYCVQ